MHLLSDCTAYAIKHRFPRARLYDRKVQALRLVLEPAAIDLTHLGSFGLRPRFGFTTGEVLHQLTLIVFNQEG